MIELALEGVVHRLDQPADLLEHRLSGAGGLAFHRRQRERDALLGQ
ncbi:hypothetical protein [Streptomyces sp. NWU49]